MHLKLIVIISPKLKINKYRISIISDNTCSVGDRFAASSSARGLESLSCIEVLLTVPILNLM